MNKKIVGKKYVNSYGGKVYQKLKKYKYNKNNIKIKAKQMIVITGGAGFIGSNLIKGLNKKDLMIFIFSIEYLILKNQI